MACSPASDAPNGTDIKAQLFGSDGAKIGEEYFINQDVSADQTDPKIVVMDNGNYAVVWQTEEIEIADGGDGSSFAVKAIIYSSTGAVVKSEFVVNEHVMNKQYEPSIASLEDGGFVVSWTTGNGTGTGSDGDEHGIKAVMFDNIGGIVKAEFIANDIAVSAQLNSTLATLVGGGFAIVFEAYALGNVGDIRLIVYDELGVMVSAEEIVDTATGGWMHSPDVAQLSNGDIAVTWTDETSVEKVRVRIYDEDGSPKGTEFTVNTVYDEDGDPIISSDFGGSFSSIAANDAGGFTITWGKYSGVRIQAQDYDNAGNQIGENYSVSEGTAGNAANVAQTDDGGMIISWQGGDGVLAQKFESAPIYKLGAWGESDFNLVAKVNGDQEGGGIDSITISGQPNNISFNHSTYANDVLTLSEADLVGSTINDTSNLLMGFGVSVTNHFDLEIGVTSTGIDGVSHTTNIVVPISLGHTRLGAHGNDDLTGYALSNDHVTGLDGIDSYTLSGDLNDYTYEVLGNELKISEIANDQNTDLLQGIETLIFDSDSVAVDELDEVLTAGNVSGLSGDAYDAWLEIHNNFQF